jgi:phosphotransferase system IIB component
MCGVVSVNDCDKKLKFPRNDTSIVCTKQLANRKLFLQGAV